MATGDVKLTLREKLVMLAIQGFTGFRVALTALRHHLLAPTDSPGPARAAYGLFIRSFRLLSRRQYMSIPSPSTTEVLSTFCQEYKLLHARDDLSNGGVVHWIGPKPLNGQKVLVYFHGGGYTHPPSAGHVTFTVRCAMSQRASLVMLEYALAPTARYPAQSHQAIEAVRHVLRAGVPASDITIAGDSAGAHLALCVLSHIIHPMPDIQPLSVEGSFGGLCLICPFLSFDYEKQSYVSNADRDILTRAVVEMFGDNFKPEGLSDADALLNPRLSPLDSPRGWFRGSPVRRVMLTMGDREIFADDIVAFAEKLEAELDPDTSFEFFCGKRETHAAAIMDATFGLSEMDSARAIVLWMSQGALVHISPSRNMRCIS